MINVYYSPWHHLSVYDDRFLTYKDPEWLLENVISQSERLNLTDNFFKCPAVIEQLKNTLVLKNTSDVHVKFENDHYQNLLQNPKLSSHVLINVKQPSVKNQRTINYSTNWVFFADKPLQMSTSVPFMHRVEHSKYGYYVPGIYDISKWFRPIEYAFQMLHAYFTDLNLNAAAFDGYKQKQSNFFENMMSQPSFYFQQE
jgi:hypothetical protein